MIYESAGFSYYLKPRIIFNSSNNQANKRDAALVSCLVSIGLPMVEHSAHGKYTRCINSMKRQNGKGNLFCMALEAVDDLIDRNSGPDEIWKHEEAEAYIEFYFETLEVIAKKIDEARCFETVCNILKKYSRSVCKREDIDIDLSDKVIQKSFNRYFEIDVGMTKKPMMAIKTRTEFAAKVKQIAGDLLGKFKIPIDNSQLGDLAFNASINGDAPAGLVVFSEYSFPSFVGRKLDKNHTIKGIEKKIKKICMDYEISIFAGTLNDCNKGSKDFGYSYGILMSSLGQSRRIYKREHAMDGRRSEVIENFISNPSVACTDKYHCEAGMMAFPICADFISVQFDDTFAECLAETDNKKISAKLGNKLNYVFCSARDFSKGNSLYRKADRPIKSWAFTGKVEAVVAQIQKRVTSENLFITFVNALDAVSCRKDSAKMNSSNLQGFFRVKDPATPATDNSVSPFKELFIKRHQSLKGKKVQVEPIRSAKKAIQAWKQSVEIDDNVTEIVSQSHYAAYCAFYLTSTQIDASEIKEDTPSETEIITDSEVSMDKLHEGPSV